MTPEEATKINIQWLAGVRAALLFLAATESDRTRRVEYGIILADACFYEQKLTDELEQIRARKPRRSRKVS